MNTKIFAFFCFSLIILQVQANDVIEGIAEKGNSLKNELADLQLKAKKLVSEAQEKGKINVEKKNQLIKNLDTHLMKDNIAMDLTIITHKERAQKLKNKEAVIGEVFQAKRFLSARYDDMKVKYDDIIKQFTN